LSNDQLEKVLITEMFGEGGEFPRVLHVVVRGDENLPEEYSGYPAYYCLVPIKPKKPLETESFELEVVHIPSNTTLRLDKKTEVFK